MGGGAKDEEDSNDFSISGPKHLESIDWNKSYDRTVVVASLVNGVYQMQRVKSEKRESPPANPWWEYFGFSLDERLINEADDSIYGAVFKYNKYDSYQNTDRMPPRYVIAFRGTLLSSDTLLSDLKQGLRCFVNTLTEGKRFKHAIQAIKTVLAKHNSGTTFVWLAGHSLGAGIALLAGKTMARSGNSLETYAFNPPHSLPPVERIPGSDVLKGGFRIATSLTKAFLAFHLDIQIQEDDPKKATWIPYLYVNPEDIFSAEYIGYFKHKKFMAWIGASKIEIAGDSFSLRSRFFGGPSAEPIHHLSSADMTINWNKSTDSEFKQWSEISRPAHGVEQWFEPDPARQENWEIQHIRL